MAKYEEDVVIVSDFPYNAIILKKMETPTALSNYYSWPL